MCSKLLLIPVSCHEVWYVTACLTYNIYGKVLSQSYAMVYFFLACIFIVEYYGNLVMISDPSKHYRHYSDCWIKLTQWLEFFFFRGTKVTLYVITPVSFICSTDHTLKWSPLLVTPCLLSTRVQTLGGQEPGLSCCLLSPFGPTVATRLAHTRPSVCTLLVRHMNEWKDSERVFICY